MLTEEELASIPEDIRATVAGVLTMLEQATIEIGQIERSLGFIRLPDGPLHVRIKALVSQNESLRREVGRLNKVSDSLGLDDSALLVNVLDLSGED
tara:strand:+ start:450 stop:737 length:288 start_codon:yes stop_codon:yes gene_type:complete